MDTPRDLFEDFTSTLLLAQVTVCAWIAGLLLIARVEDMDPGDILLTLIGTPVSFCLSVISLFVLGHLLRELGRGLMVWIKPQPEHPRP